MKEVELRDCAECANCHKKIGGSGLPLFWRITVERFGVDLNAVRRQDGLAARLDGHAGLAAVMGPDEDLAVPLMEPVKITLCETCSVGGEVSIAALALGER